MYLLYIFCPCVIVWLLHTKQAEACCNFIGQFGLTIGQMVLLTMLGGFLIPPYPLTGVLMVGEPLNQLVYGSRLDECPWFTGGAMPIF